MDFEKMEESKNFINELIDLIGGDEKSPIDFKILKAHKDYEQCFSKIINNKKFIKMDDDSEIKKTMLKLLEESIKIFKEIDEKIETLEEE